MSHFTTTRLTHIENQDGYGLPLAHVMRAAELGMSAMALTEHGNVSSHVKLEQAAEKMGIKPIFGLEAYTAPADMRETGNRRKWHLTILAMNEIGYQNLNKIVTRSWAEGFYQWPTVSGQMLSDHNEGLIVLSGCLDSNLACNLLGGKGKESGSVAEAHAVIRKFKALFGDRYYIETQQFPEIGRARQLNVAYEEMAEKLGVGLVATSDCHYPLASDNEMQKILHAAGRNIGSVEAAEAQWEYDIKLTLPTSDEVLLERLRATGLSLSAAGSALANTADIAARCNVTLPKMNRFRYPLEEEPGFFPGQSAERMLRDWLNDGWKYRGWHRLSRADQIRRKERVEYELSVIIPKDFIDYFLMTSDVIRHTKDAGVPVGPARGSAAASAVCYLLRITEIDPMDHPLMMFERFIDLNRDDLPDIDLDFDDEHREFARQHLIQKYGSNRVGNIGTFTKYKGKNSIDDVARVYGIPKYEAERAKSFLVERSGGDSRFDDSIGDTVELFPAVKEIFEKYPALYHTLELEGNYKGFGVHAAGIVVGAEPINNYVAMYERTVKENVLQVLSVDKYDGEHLNLMKLDFLSLKTMGMIRIAIGYIGMTLEDLYAIPNTDPETLAAFEKADVTGIFQFEGRTTRMVCQEVAPTCFADLAAINALSRPGPLHSGSTGDFIAVKHGRAEIEHIHPLVDELCGTTHGQIIYQEQILALCRNMGKFPWVHAAEIRKVISQKKGEQAFNKLTGMFVEGAASQGIDLATAMKTWRRLVTAGTYAFNIAHCISYATLGFWAQWLKQHHPIAFYAAQLAKTDPNDKKRRHIALMRDMQDPRYGRVFKIYPPHLDESGLTWAPTEDGVRAGFEQVPGIGVKTAKAIVRSREEDGPYAGWDDMQRIAGVGPKTVETIRGFTDREDPFGLDKIKDNVAKIRRAIDKDSLFRSLDLPMPDTLAEDVPYEAVRSSHVCLAVVRAKNPQDLFENHRSRTGEDLDPATVKQPELKDSMTLYCEDVSGLMTVKVSRFVYPKLKNDLQEIVLDKDYILFRANKYPIFNKTIHMTEMWTIDPTAHEELPEKGEEGGELD